MHNSFPHLDDVENMPRGPSVPYFTVTPSTPHLSKD